MNTPKSKVDYVKRIFEALRTYCIESTGMCHVLVTEDFYKQHPHLEKLAKEYNKVSYLHLNIRPAEAMDLVYEYQGFSFTCHQGGKTCRVYVHFDAVFALWDCVGTEMHRPNISVTAPISMGLNPRDLNLREWFIQEKTALTVKDWIEDPDTRKPTGRPTLKVVK